MNKMPDLKHLYTIGGVAALLQFVTVLAMAVVMATLGPKPASVEAYFVLQQSSKLAAVLRGDFLIMILIGLYLGTCPALYVALRRISPVYTAFFALMTLSAVVGAFASDATFALLHLGAQYAAATTEAARAALLAAGEAVIASDLWNSSAGYMGGILLQGTGVMISVVMLRSKDFSKVTAYAGLIGNGLDLIQHVLHPFFPALPGVIRPVMGIFYIVWYPMLARDFFRLSKRGEKNEL